MWTTPRRKAASALDEPRLTDALDATSILMGLLLAGVVLISLVAAITRWLHSVHYKRDLQRFSLIKSGHSPPLAEGQPAVSLRRALWRGFRTRTGRFLSLFERWVVLPSTLAVVLLYIYFLITDPPPWKTLADAYFLTVLLFLVPFLLLAAQVRHLLQTRLAGQIALL